MSDYLISPGWQPKNCHVSVSLIALQVLTESESQNCGFGVAEVLEF